MNLRWTILLVSALLAGAAQAAPGDRKDVVRDLAGRVGPMVGSALACRDVARPRIQVLAEKFTAVITEFSASEAERARAVGVDDSAILRLNYHQCDTVDADDAVDQLNLQKPPIKAVVIAAVYPAAAKFFEMTHDFFPGMIYTNVSGVGGTALADELILPQPRYAAGAIVTQVVPAVSGYSSVALEYKNALAKYFPGEAPDYVSLEGFVSANIPIQALKRAGPQLDTEKLIDVLENMRNLDPGLGVPLSFGRAEHQASHRIWGTAIDENGKYQAIVLE